eukprot:4315744-Ditylum_brightwellii.AAC.1
MEKIPSALVLYQKVDGLDTCMRRMQLQYTNSLLEQWLVVVRVRTYHQANKREPQGFDKVREMWSTEVGDSDDSSSNKEEESQQRAPSHHQQAVFQEQTKQEQHKDLESPATPSTTKAPSKAMAGEKEGMQLRNPY